MYTIAFISQKGGAGKTTLALNLAVAETFAGGIPLVLDLDPQASASTWAHVRGTETPTVAPAHAPRLDQALETARQNGATLTILDTAPHAQSAALDAARAADLVLIPCRPALFDIRAATASSDVARLAATQAVAVLSAAPPRGSLALQAHEALAAQDIQLAACVVAQRAAHVHAITRGLSVLEHDPRGKAAEEIRALHAWTTARLATTGA